ncbi:serine/arginine repetitive matrix protein 2-like [Betta splendens]|uniref:E3 ubiquitin-protein ligase Topors n=1 Tax=Betta splendens TaxID=158456 RepID=A0A6P7KVY0_BETSP|nr:serine/arginine repetitive matrix protein 2-like [Betta splendens]
MAPTRMKLRVRRRDNTAGGAGDGQPARQGERRRESAGRGSRRKNASNTTAEPASAAAAAAATSSALPTSSASASVRAVMAAEDASPDSKCPICLDRFNNLAYLDRCLHRFCFPCIQEWSHNKPECPLCKQPFTSILHSVRAENDFKEYTLRPAPADSNIAATVAMVAAMASRIDHQMRLQLRRHRVEDGGEMTTRRHRRERGGGGGSRRAGERSRGLEWYLDSNNLPHIPHHPSVGTDDSDEAENLAQRPLRREADLAERGVIFEGLTGLGGAVAPLAPNERASRRLITRLAARQRVQREGGSVRRLREREMVAFRRALYRCGIRVCGVAGVTGNQGNQQRDITAESFRQNSAHLNRLRPWLRRELTVLYGAHGVLVHIVQRLIMARLALHGLEDTPTVEEELRPFLLARTDHFLHELVSFARSPLSLDNYDLQAVYEPPAAALELDGVSSSSESSSVIAISEGEEEEQTRGRSEEGLQGRSVGAHDIDIQTGSCLSLSAWDDETPGPSYSTAEPSCSLASLSFSPVPQEASHEVGGEKREEGEAEEECLIVGYKKPIAERTPELVQLSSDTEEDAEEKKEEKEKVEVEEKPPPLTSTPPPLSYLPTVPPSTSGAYRDKKADALKDKGGEAEGQPSRGRSWSGSSGRSPGSVFTLSPSERLQESWKDRKQSGSEAAKERRRRKKRRRGRERSSEWLRRSGTLFNPNRAMYPAMMRRRSPSPFHSSIDSGSPLPPSPPDSSWDYNCSPLSSSISSSSHSSSSPLSTSPHPSLPPQTPPTPSLSPRNPCGGEKPGGKRKYKSRHLDSNKEEASRRPSNSLRREKRRKRMEKERRKRRGGDGGRRRERHQRGSHKEAGGYGGESSSRRLREERSPSVEIIYEGTTTAGGTQPPCKRRKRRPRRTQHSSSPVIITLDSDSSRDAISNRHAGGGSSSSSPLSSQQTVDFSDLPPLALLHSASAAGGLEAHVGELPVDILDRGSDGSDTEPVEQPEALVPVDKGGSDHEVDVESVERSSSVLGRKAAKDDTSNDPREPAGGTGPAGGADRCLLATVLSDLRGISAPQSDVAFGFEPSCSPESRNQRFRNPCEEPVAPASSNEDPRLAQSKAVSASFPEERQGRGLDLSSCHRSRGKQDPLPPGHAHLLHLADTGSTVVGSDPTASLHSAEFCRRTRRFPQVPALDRRFGLALRELGSASGAAMERSSRHVAPAGSHSAAAGAEDLWSSKFRSSTENAHGTRSAPRASSTDSLPVGSGALFHSAGSSWSSGEPADCDSTSGGQTRSALPSHLHPHTQVPAKDPCAGGGASSGAHSNNTSPLVSLSPTDARTHDSQTLDEKQSCLASDAGGRTGVSEEHRPPPTTPAPPPIGTAPPPIGTAPPPTGPAPPPIGTAPAPPPTGTAPAPPPTGTAPAPPPIGTAPPPTTPAPPPIGTAPPPIGTAPPLCAPAPPPTAPAPPPTAPAPLTAPVLPTPPDRAFSHAAFCSRPPALTMGFHTSPRKCASNVLCLNESEPKHRNHVGAGSTSRFHSDSYSRTLHIDSQCESQPPTDLRPRNSVKDLGLHTNSCLSLPQRPVRTQWNSNSTDTHSDSQSPVDERSGSSVWNTLPFRTDD